MLVISTALVCSRITSPHSPAPESTPSSISLGTRSVRFALRLAFFAPLMSRLSTTPPACSICSQSAETASSKRSVFRVSHALRTIFFSSSAVLSFAAPFSAALRAPSAGALFS